MVETFRGVELKSTKAQGRRRYYISVNVPESLNEQRPSFVEIVCGCHCVWEAFWCVGLHAWNRTYTGNVNFTQIGGALRIHGHKG